MNTYLNRYENSNETKKDILGKDTSNVGILVVEDVEEGVAEDCWDVFSLLCRCLAEHVLSCFGEEGYSLWSVDIISESIQVGGVHEMVVILLETCRVDISGLPRLDEAGDEVCL